MLKLLVLLLIVSCRADVVVDPTTDPTTDETQHDDGDENDDKNDKSNRACPSQTKQSNEHYHLNFIKPQSREHEQVIMEYFKRFNTELKAYHRRHQPSHCPPLDDILVFVSDSSDACEIDEIEKGMVDCVLYSTINIENISTDKDSATGGYARRNTFWQQNSDGTTVNRYWVEIVLDIDHFLKNHQAKQTMAWLIFLHEAGHGFGLKHNEQDKHDIMHPVLKEGTTYDYDTFFKSIYQVITTAHLE